MFRLLSGMAPLGVSAAGFCVFLGAAGIALNAAQAPRRIYAAIEDSKTYTLAGNTKPILPLAKDQGDVSGALALPRMTMHFAMTSQQQEDLQTLLSQLQTPGAAQFHKFLTPEDYGARFGVHPGDIAKITAWLSANGFSNIEVARSRTFVTFSGTASQAQAAFHTAIHNYHLNGETHYANSADPLLPQALQGMVESIRGLNNFRRKPHNISVRPHFTSSISGSHFLVPDDWATLYDVQPLYSAGFDGTGVSIAVVGQSDIALSDLQAFRAAAGLPAKDPTIVTVGSDPGIPSAADEQESDLDLEWSGGIAKNASVIFVTAQDVLDAETDVIDNNRAPIMSISYGLCESQLGSAESNTEAVEAEQANAQGITIVAAAGDAGAADCDTNAPATLGMAVDVPAALPYVTGIGGTSLTEGSGAYWNTTNNSYGGSAISYIPEVVWNDPITSTNTQFGASGGGASSFNAKPTWQKGTGVANDGARDVPDLAFAGSDEHDEYLICSGGLCMNGFRQVSTDPNVNNDLDAIGGTSTGSPSFAGVVALLLQQFGPQGNINPNLYALAAASTDVFHDITSGNNIVACTVAASDPGCVAGNMGYSAGVGYDLASGWGSLDVAHMVNEWKNVLPTVVASEGPLGFVPVTPCRVVDTRNAVGPFGGPELGGPREFDIPKSACNIPSTAVAYALNVTVVPDGELGYLEIWPSGRAKPLVSTLNSDGRVKADAAIVPAGANGGVDVYVTNPTHVIIDISGYFLPSGSSGLQFFPLTPCRVADTRNAGPSLTGGQARAFSVAGTCSVPATAQAYSLNFTAIPSNAKPLQFLAAWPAGQAQPTASILNAGTGTVTANAAIIPSTNGSIMAYGSDNTDVVIDINGYFAPPASNGLSFYTLTPCRVIDTRNPAGTAAFNGLLTVDVTTSGCASPSTAQAYVLNATVVPSGILGYLSLWPNGQNQPVVSTLNADNATVTSNMALVPTTNGSVDAFASQPTYLILDISGYFAP